MVRCEEYYKNWYIKGIAESVIREINDDGCEYEEMEDVLDDYLQDVYWSVHSREMDDADVVVGLVRQYIYELEEEGINDSNCKV